jgi:hypothetical protein
MTSEYASANLTGRNLIVMKSEARREDTRELDTVDGLRSQKRFFPMGCEMRDQSLWNSTQQENSNEPSGGGSTL